MGCTLYLILRAKNDNVLSCSTYYYTRYIVLLYDENIIRSLRKQPHNAEKTSRFFSPVVKYIIFCGGAKYNNDDSF